MRKLKCLIRSYGTLALARMYNRALELPQPHPWRHRRRAALLSHLHERYFPYNWKGGVN